MHLRSFVAIALATFGTAAVLAQDAAPVTPDSLVAAAKRAAGSDHEGTFTRICVAPDNLTPRAPPPITGPRTLTVAYSGGTAFNFPRLAENFAIYRDSANKMLAAASAAGATVLMTNHTDFDGTYDRARIAQLPREAGEPHPYETSVASVQHYFEMQRDCAEAQRLSME